MSFYGVVFRLVGWAIGLGLITGQLTYYRDGRTDGLMIAAGWGILIWWAVVTWPYIVGLLQAANEGSEGPAKRAVAAATAPAQTAATMVTCPTCGVEGTAEPAMSDHGQLLALRGHHEGRPIVRCLCCNEGFSLSVGMARPMIVSAERWTAMDAMWRASFPDLARNEDRVLERNQRQLTEEG